MNPLIPTCVAVSNVLARSKAIAVSPSQDLVLYLARHACGTKICREKGIEYARRLLGHANISTTQRYVTWTIASLRRRRI